MNTNTGRILPKACVSSATSRTTTLSGPRKRTQASTRRIIGSLRISPNEMLTAIQIGSIGLRGCVNPATSSNEPTQSRRHVIRIYPTWLTGFALAATASGITIRTQKRHDKTLAGRRKSSENASGMNCLRLTAASAPVRSVQRLIRHSSHSNTSTETVKSIGRRSAVMHMPICDAEAGRKRVTRCCAGTVTRGHGSPESAHTWKGI